MAGAGMTDVGRGSRRFALPNGHTIGEGWVNDPRQAYQFGKAGIVPQDTGELEGMHGEGVRGSVAGLGPSRAQAFNGLKSVMNPDEGSGGPDRDSLRMLSRYGLVGDPETVAAENQAKQRAATAIPKLGYQRELEQEDTNTRAALAKQSLIEMMSGRQEDTKDYESERGQERLTLPFAAHNRYNDAEQKSRQIDLQYNEPERLRGVQAMALEGAKAEAARSVAELNAQAAGDRNQTTVLGHLATAPNSSLDPAQRDAAKRSLMERTGSQFSPDIEAAIALAVRAGFPRDVVVQKLRAQGKIR